MSRGIPTHDSSVRADEDARSLWCHIMVDRNCKNTWFSVTGRGVVKLTTHHHLVPRLRMNPYVHSQTVFMTWFLIKHRIKSQKVRTRCFGPKYTKLWRNGKIFFFLIWNKHDRINLRSQFYVTPTLLTAGITYRHASILIFFLWCITSGVAILTFEPLIYEWAVYRNWAVPKEFTETHLLSNSRLFTAPEHLNSTEGSQ
jgi:hypothetical protein